MIMRAAVGIRIVLTLAGVAIAVAFSVLAGYGPRMVLGTALAGAALMLQLLQSLLSVTLQSELRFGWATAADLVRQAVNALLVVALVLAGAGLVPLLAAAIPAAAASLVFTLPLVVGRTALRPSFHLPQWWELVREAVPWAAIAAVNVVYFRLALVLMSVIAVAAETGYFATSFRVVEVLIGIPGLLITAAFPILARAVQDDRVRFAAATRRLFELSLIAGTWLVVCLEVDAGFAIHILAGNKADPAITVLRIQGIAVIGTFISMACGFPLLTLRRYRETLIANLMSLVLVGILTVALVPSMGANGAALAAVIAEGALALTQATILTRVAPDVRLSVIALPIVAVAGLLAVGAGLAAPVHPVIGAIVASVVYVAVLRLLGRFPPEAREVLASRWRPASR